MALDLLIIEFSTYTAVHDAKQVLRLRVVLLDKTPFQVGLHTTLAGPTAHLQEVCTATGRSAQPTISPKCPSQDQSVKTSPLHHVTLPLEFPMVVSCCCC
jgi:hypothetical protein